MDGHQSIVTRTGISKMKNSYYYKQSLIQILILIGGIANCVSIFMGLANSYLVAWMCLYHILSYSVLMRWNYWWARHVDYKAKKYLDKDIWDGVDYE